MRSESLEFLTKLLKTPSPSGFEQPVQRIIRKRMKRYADKITPDVHGNTVVALNPKGSPRVMLAGHVDQIGFMIRHITDDGYIYFGRIGGIDATVVPGLTLTVHTNKGTVEGVVGRKAIHLMTPEERTSGKVDLDTLWLDIGARNKKAAEKRVSIGDPITYSLGVTKMGRDFLASPGMDDKVGAFVVMEALRLIKKSGKKCKCAVFAVGTVQEELGLRGARTSCFGVDPHVGIAVDVTHSADYPGASKNTIGDLALGKGPVISVGPNINPVVGELLIKTAAKRNIPYQPEGEPFATGTDANAIQVTRAGVAAGLVSIPNRYMHTPIEVVSLSDLTNSAKLLAETCMRITPKTDFIPK